MDSRRAQISTGSNIEVHGVVESTLSSLRARVTRREVHPQRARRRHQRPRRQSSHDGGPPRASPTLGPHASTGDLGRRRRWRSRRAEAIRREHAGATEVRPDDRGRLEHLCCCLLRPPLAERRLRLLPSGTVALELESPWRDGTTWLSMSAHTFLERLRSLVPRPRTNQSSIEACSLRTPLAERRWCPSLRTTPAPRTPPSAS
jgi:hypothetical protein